MNNENQPPSLPAVPDTKEEEKEGKALALLRYYLNRAESRLSSDSRSHDPSQIETLQEAVAELEKKEIRGRTTWECGCGTTNGVNLATCGVCNRPRGEGEVPWKKAKTLEELGAVAANTRNGLNTQT